MALSVFSSNRVEFLQHHLAKSLADSPPGSPFEPETIVVPTFAMSRWLEIRIAQQLGIAANIDFPQPRTWIWQLASNLIENLPDQDPFSGEKLGWAIFTLLPEALFEAAFQPLRSYLDGDSSGVKRWQLSQRLGVAFDRYQNYRPNMIRDWSNGQGSQWQALLWRKILAGEAHQHRVEIITRMISRLENDKHITRLPLRASLFGLSSLPPLFIELIRAIGRHTDLTLYLHSPTHHYWADLQNEKGKARHPVSSEPAYETQSMENELLASWGKQGQVFQDLLLENGGQQSVDIDLFDHSHGDHLLGKIQHSIFDLDCSPLPTAADPSLSVHVCHSPLRECQVLRDQLMAMLERNTALSPEDILVMIPDIGTYSASIETVFHQSELPFNLSDVSTADAHPLVAAFRQLIRLPQSRFPVSEINALLDCEALCRRFDINPTALVEVRTLFSQAHTRWGIDGAHKQELGLPTTGGNTWRQLRDRFFAGYALGGDQLWNGVAPLSTPSQDTAETFAKLFHFIDTLCAWRERLGKPATATGWQHLLLNMTEVFFAEASPFETSLQQIREAIGKLGSASTIDISPTLIGYLLDQSLETHQHAGRLYTGGITFCGMRPMRSVPFQVICLVGMNSTAFPRHDEVNDYELLNEQFIAGDPSQRDEDRYLMLETLLCARSALYISYSGRSLKDNSKSPPSVVVQELLDFIDNQFQPDPGDIRLSDQLTSIHPMQAFSPRNFESTVPGYSHFWCNLTNQLQNRQAMDPCWPSSPLPRFADNSFVLLDHLRRFAVHPIAYFYRHRLGIYLQEDQPNEDDETFTLGGIERWMIRQQLGSDLLSGENEEIERYLAEGILQHGPAANAQWWQIRQECQPWLKTLQPYRNRDHGDVAVEVRFDIGDAEDGIIAGNICGYYPDKGLMRYQGGKLKARQLLSLWLDHLMLCASGGDRSNRQATLISLDQTWQINAVAPSAAIVLLRDYFRLYQEGLRYPLPVFPEASFEWACINDSEKARVKAHGRWSQQLEQDFGGDANDIYIQLALRNQPEPPFDDRRFDEFAQRFYASLIAHSGLL